jgi:transposase
MLMQLVCSTIVDVSIKERLTEAQVYGIVDRHINPRVDWEFFNYLGVLGIDEISIKKGPKNFMSIISCRHKGQNRLLAVINGREKDKIKMFLKSIPTRLKKQ